MLAALVAAEELDTLSAVAEASVAGQAGHSRRQVDILRTSSVVAVHYVAVASVEVAADTVFEEVAVDIPDQGVAWSDTGWVVVTVAVLMPEFEAVTGCDT